MHPPSVLGLYWSIRGEVACDEHAPDADNPRWTTDGWAPIPMSSGHVQGTRYQCQHCATDGRAVIHDDGTTRPPGGLEPSSHIARRAAPSTAAARALAPLHADDRTPAVAERADTHRRADDGDRRDRPGGIFVFVGHMLTGLFRAWRAERLRQDTLARLHNSRRRFASAVYPIAAALVIVAALVYFTDDVRTTYRLALAGLALATLVTAARNIIREL